jgi:hypothetical protein
VLPPLLTLVRAEVAQELMAVGANGDANVRHGAPISAKTPQKPLWLLGSWHCFWQHING